jgi:hypothetical protein
MSMRTNVLLVACWAAQGCDDSAFFGEKAAPTKPAIEPPPQVKPPARPKECQTAMDLITSCGVALEPTRIAAVAECKQETYLGDAELQVFLRCLGETPSCEQLVRCSGPIAAGAAAGAPADAGGAK